MNEYRKVNTDGKKAIIYLRVSTEEQVDNFSLETQQDICIKEAQKRGYEIIDTFKEEGRSAKSITGRPVLINLLEYCRKNKNNVQALFVYRLDRISRQTGDYLAIRKKLAEQGITILSATEPTGDSPTEKLVETILAGFAQLDNDIRSERTKNGLRARFLSGLISYKPPLGYLFKSGYAVKDPETFDLVKKSWSLMATGTKSLQEMATIMNEWGLREVYIGEIHLLRAQTVNAIFRNKFYMGKLTSKKHPEEIKGQHIPMVTEEQFYKVQAILDGRNLNLLSATKRTYDNPAFPLRRIVKCRRCGIGMTAGWSKGRNSNYAYYRCSNNCPNSNVKTSLLDNAVVSVLKEVTPKKECLELFIQFLEKTYYDRVSQLQKITQDTDSDIEKLRALRATLVEKNLSGVYSDEVFKEQNAIIEDKIARAMIVKDDSKLDKYNIVDVTSFVRTLLADLGETYKRSSISQIKVLFGSMFPTGLTWDENGTLNHTLSPIYQSIRTFDACSIRFGTPCRI